MDAKYLLIVKVPKGLVIRNTPRPEGQGGVAMRTVAVGTTLEAYNIVNIEGVPYARLVPPNPVKPEWVRVAEADRSIEYVDVIKLEPDDAGGLATAIHDLAEAIREMAKK